ncbi:hypothetical protein L3X38_025532 [Prunus dulcis]|uniref:Uncharacterized protein n=1 Tax=Prunus dulcis TaxID=3755 RepID=A0AAD4W1W1_PRUDU|nr:hypothetical protein L3X38_025532 [Prunus dulcis]
MDVEGFVAIFFFWSSDRDPWYEPVIELASKTGESERSLEFCELEKLLSSFLEFLSSAREVFFFAPKETKLITGSRLQFTSFGLA